MARKQSGRRPHKVGDRRPGWSTTERGERAFAIGDTITITITPVAGQYVLNIQAPRSEAIRKIPLQKELRQ